MLLAVKNNCISTRRADLERNVEMVVIEIESPNSPNIIVAAFIGPRIRMMFF